MIHFAKYRFSEKLLFSNLWIITALLFLFRTIFEPLKYLAVLALVILFIAHILYLFKYPERIKEWRFILSIKEILILALLMLWGIMISDTFLFHPIKELVNFLIVLYLAVIYIHIKTEINWIKFIKVWLVFSVSIGTLAIIIWLNSFLSIYEGLFSSLGINNSSTSISLTGDYNFYSLYFILSFCMWFYSIQKKILKTRLVFSQLIVFIFTLNIILSTSRRAFIVFSIILFIGSLYFAIRYKNLKSNRLFVKNVVYFLSILLTFFIIIVCLIPVRTRVIKKQDQREKITGIFHKYTTLFNSKSSAYESRELLWPYESKYYDNPIDWDEHELTSDLEQYIKKLRDEYWIEFKNNSDKNNLLYNGDFLHGLKFWTNSTSPKDSVSHSLIKTPYGRGVRVERLSGDGQWPLRYKGRSIIYYKGVTYTFKFKYKNLENTNDNFNIGWWIKEDGNYISNLNKKIRKLDNNWYECMCKYTFKNTHKNGSVPTFMNSQSAGSTIVFSDIKLYSNDTLDRVTYVDQLQFPNSKNILYNGNFSEGLKFWNKIAPAQDSIVQELVQTPFGTGVRISRLKGTGWWSLNYTGRDIYYKKGVTYSFRFVYRVLKGHGKPFKIGWWTKENGHFLNDIEQSISPIMDGWKECIASYTFQQDHLEPVVTFMNSQEPNTIIELTNIELLCPDSLFNSCYVDQNIGKLKEQKQDIIEMMILNDTVNDLSDPRLERWRYGWELYSKYSIVEKVFGGGFDYMYLFSKKFVTPNEKLDTIKQKQLTDYPHNFIISAFLYSGIIGGLFVIYYIMLSFSYYWKFRKELRIFTLLYVITFTYVFFSGNTIFSVPIFVILSIVPFVYRYIKNKGKLAENGINKMTT